jgi:hypothetical protein
MPAVKKKPDGILDLNTKLRILHDDKTVWIVWKDSRKNNKNIVKENERESVKWDIIFPPFDIVWDV